MLIQTEVSWLEIIEMRQMSGMLQTQLLSSSSGCVPMVKASLLNTPTMVEGPEVPAGETSFFVTKMSKWRWFKALGLD